MHFSVQGFSPFPLSVHASCVYPFLPSY